MEMCRMNKYFFVANFEGFMAQWTRPAAAHEAKGVTRTWLTNEDKVWMLESLNGAANCADATVAAQVVGRLSLDGVDLDICAAANDAAFEMQEKGMKMKTMWNFLALLALCILGGCGAIGGGVRQWQEEVALPDAKTIIVERSHVLGSTLDRELSSMNAPPGAKSYVISIPLPNGGQAKWTAEDKDMIPLALSVSGNVAQVLASPSDCAAYSRLGRPVPPFLIFRYDSGRWVKATIDEFPSAITEANLMISTDTQRAVDEINKGLVTAGAIKRLNEGIGRRRIYRQGVIQDIWVGCLREIEAGRYGKNK